MADIRYDSLLEAYESQKPVEALVREKQKKGFVVELFGMECFMPGSETYDKTSVEEGDTIDVRVMKLNPAKNNVVVSNRSVAEERRAEEMAQISSALKEGDIVEGTVKSLMDYGFFVTVGGVLDGLVPTNEVSWARFSSVGEIVSVGDRVKVKVLDIKEKNGKRLVSFSLKQANGDPWAEAKAEDYVDRVFDCVVMKVVSFGAIVKAGNLDGLIYKKEISWMKDQNPEEIFQVGQVVRAKVISFDTVKRKMALSMKALAPDPWEGAEERYPVGAVRVATVGNIANFGAYVELEDGIEGLLHISDMSWEKIKHPSEVVATGDAIEVKVLGVDVASRRISLGHKQLVPDPWDAIEARFSEETEEVGKVDVVNEKGAEVILDGGVKGFVKAAYALKNDGSRVAAGETLMFRVNSLQRTKRRIMLSYAGPVIQADPVKVGPVQAGSPAVRLEQRKAESMSPEQKDLADFLNLFSRDDGFKFLTHDIKTAGIDLVEYVSDCQERLLNWKDEHFVPEDLYELIKGFIFGKCWKGFDDRKHYTYCSSEEWVDTYVDTDEHPMNSPRMAGDVDVFRNTIRWRSGQLEKYIRGLQEKYTRININVAKNLRGADFYMDTRALRNAINEIFQSMEEFSMGHNEVNVSFSEESLGDGYSRAVLTIEQPGSLPLHTLARDTGKLSNGGGTLGNIRTALAGNASWAVESRWLGDTSSRRWNILGGDPQPQDIPEVNGFRHIISVIHKA